MFAPVCQTSGVEPRPADLEAPVLGPEREEAAAADDPPVGLPDRRERELEPGSGVRERALDVVA